LSGAIESLDERDRQTGECPELSRKALARGRLRVFGARILSQFTLREIACNLEIFDLEEFFQAEPRHSSAKHSPKPLQHSAAILSDILERHAASQIQRDACISPDH